MVGETGNLAGQGAQMSVNELKSLLDQVPDTRELVLRRAATWAPVADAWRDAREDATAAYRVWDLRRDAASYAAYRAAQDREDAAQDALAKSPG
jgi:hypothetical protein